MHLSAAQFPFRSQPNSVTRSRIVTDTFQQTGQRGIITASTSWFRYDSRERTHCGSPSRVLPFRRQALSAVHGKPAFTDGLIDFHHHIRPPNVPPYVEQLMAGWSPEGAVAEMDMAGIAKGMAFPGPLIGPDPQANRKLARGWNDYGALIGARHPGRFGLFASLPMTDIDGTLAEIDHALCQLDTDGFGIITNYGERWLGDDVFAPIYEALNACRAVVFVHPTDAPCCAPVANSYGQPGMDGSWIEWPMNTARTILSLMASGTLRRYPDIRFVFSHGGGVMPMLIRRIAGLAAWRQVGQTTLDRFFPDGVETEFARLRFECAQACTATNMEALRSLVPDENILFGSDYPVFPLDYAARMFASIDLPVRTRSMIASGNARALMAGH